MDVQTVSEPARQPDQRLAPHSLVDRCARGVASLAEGEQLRRLFRELLDELAAREQRIKDLTAIPVIHTLSQKLAAREQENAEMALQSNRLLRVLRDTEQQLQDAQTENAALRGVLAEVLREQAKQLDVILARLQRLKDSASVSVPPQRDVVRDALERLVADLETNSEAGAPDYAHDALKQSVPSQDTNE